MALAAPQIDAVLVHELGHLQRRDDVWNLVQQIAQIFYWPHPLTWVAARLIAEVREQACDEPMRPLGRRCSELPDDTDRGGRGTGRA